jgi:predicted O-methyltransferase YrrM
VGTYRARTTYAFQLNAPQSKIISYDIRKVASAYRSELEQNALVELRLADFSTQKAALGAEAPFDLIFIDGGHRTAEVLADSEIAFSILSPSGVIVWHDYRVNEFFNPGLQVPEALHQLSPKYAIRRVPGTTCAVYFAPGFQSRTFGT